MSEVAEENNVQDVGQEEGVDSSPSKKETFQWNTPADEFAEDVGSDIDEESEDEGGDNANRSQGDDAELAEGSHFSEVANGQIDVVNKSEVVSPPKKSKAKNQFPCPKCNKVWNWPWELRRHLVMHFKEVCNFTVILY